MAFVIDLDQFYSDQPSDITIKVVGIGSFGCSALNHTIEKKLAKVDYLAVHSDPQALQGSKAAIKVRVGGQFQKEKESKKRVSNGSWNRFTIGDDDRQNIAKQLHGADMVILVAGMGNGSSMLLTPGVALVAKNMGILTLGLVTMPFACEGRDNQIAAGEGLAELRKYVDTIIVIDSDLILSSASPTTTSVSDAFSLPNEVIYRAIKGMTDLLMHKGNIKVNFADVAELLSGAGEAVFAAVSAFGDDGALQAVTEALKTLETGRESIKQTHALLVNITGKVTMKDLSAAMAYIEQEVGCDTQIINGYIDEPTDSGEIRAILIATGLRRKLPAQQPHPRTPLTGRALLPGNAIVQNPPGKEKKPDYKTPAYERRGVFIKAVEEYKSALFYKDRINKESPELPAFLRLISEN